MPLTGAYYGGKKKKRTCLFGILGILVGAAAVLYYIAAGLLAGFSVSVLWVWLAAGGVLLVLGAADLLTLSVSAVWRIGILLLRYMILLCVVWFFAVQMCVLYGIAEERLILEPHSATTAENVRNACLLIDDPAATVAVVTSNFHVYRTMCIARKAGFSNVHGIAAPFRSFMLPHYMAREFLTITVDTLRGNM